MNSNPESTTESYLDRLAEEAIKDYRRNKTIKLTRTNGSKQLSRYHRCAHASQYHVMLRGSYNVPVFIKLSKEGTVQFVNAILNPPEPSEALRRAMKQYYKRIHEDLNDG